MHALNDSPDPISALIAHDWASFGGWSLFIGLGVFLIVGLVTERLVPGARYRRMEEAATRAAETSAELAKLNDRLVTANEITKHFFEETTPRRGETP